MKEKMSYPKIKNLQHIDCIYFVWEDEYFRKDVDIPELPRIKCWKTRYDLPQMLVWSIGKSYESDGHIHQISYKMRISEKTFHSGFINDVWIDKNSKGLKQQYLTALRRWHRYYKRALNRGNQLYTANLVKQEQLIKELKQY